jgi:hypothetical protein
MNSCLYLPPYAGSSLAALPPQKVAPLAFSTDRLRSAGFDHDDALAFDISRAIASGVSADV